MIIVIRGLPGSGKTTLARKLADYTMQEFVFVGVVVLSTDVIRKELFSKPKYTSEESALVYKVLFYTAQQLNLVGTHCILDATFINDNGDSTSSISHEVGVKESDVKIIECICAEDVAISRIKNRKNDYSDADETIYYAMKDVYKITKNPHITVDTTNDIDLKEITKLLY